MEIMRFAHEPPPRGSGVYRARDAQVFADAVQALAQRPGEWGLVAEASPDGARIRAALKRLGCEVTTRGVASEELATAEDGDSKLVDVWARIPK